MGRQTFFRARNELAVLALVAAAQTARLACDPCSGYPDRVNTTLQLWWAA
jgi:hypothetical protein